MKENDKLKTKSDPNLSVACFDLQQILLLHTAIIQFCIIQENCVHLTLQFMSWAQKMDTHTFGMRPYLEEVHVKLLLVYTGFCKFNQILARKYHSLFGQPW